MSYRNYYAQTSTRKPGLLWVIGTGIHYLLVLATVFSALATALVLIVGIVNMDFSSWSVWLKSADSFLVGVAMAFVVGFLWSVYNTVRKTYLNAYRKDGAFGVITMTLKLPFIILSAILSLAFGFIEAMPKCKQDEGEKTFQQCWDEDTKYEQYLKQQRETWRH